MERNVTDAPSHRSEVVPYIAADELARRLDGADRPVLVEFSVPAGCYHCDAMRGQVEMLAERLAGRVEVCRVNLNHERMLTSQLGIGVCPTYVAFWKGKEAFRASYPTSGDLLNARVEEVISHLDSLNGFTSR
jgi:thioredoxin-like negative regulator of GroEL